MGIIRNLIDRRRVWRTLPDYPVYAPPFRDAERVPTRAQADANYDYFFEHKAARLEYLAAYFAGHGIALSLAPERLPALDRWLYRYGGHLVPIGDDTIFSMATYVPAWTGDYHSLNVINDLGIFAGEYIIAGNKNARWGLWRGDGSKRAYEKEGFCQPCVFGLHQFSYTNPRSMLGEMYRCCDAGTWRLREGASPLQTWDVPGELVRRLDYLADANAPDPIPFSHRVIDD